MAQKKKMTKRRLAEMEKKAKAEKRKKIIIISVILAVVIALSVLIPVRVIESKKVKKYYATIDVEGYGAIEVELDKESAPKTVARFEKLANEGFVAKAPEKVILAEREKLAKATERMAKIKESLAAFEK